MRVRALPKVTDKTDDVEVLSCGLAASDALYLPAAGAAAVEVGTDGAATAAAAAAAGDGAAACSGSRASGGDLAAKLAALGAALGLTLATEYDATSGAAVDTLPLKPRGAEGSAEGSVGLPLDVAAEPAWAAAATALESMAVELAHELKKTALLGAMLRAARAADAATAIRR